MGGEIISNNNMKLKQGDIVLVRGNKHLMMIEWFINNSVAMSYCWDLLKNEEIDWVVLVFGQRGGIKMRMI